MNKDFTTMKTNVGTDLMDTDATFLTILGRALNVRYFQVLRAINWNAIRDAHVITTVAGTQNYALPEDFGKAIYCLDTTNGIEINDIGIPDMVRNYPDDLTTQGTVNRYGLFEDVVKTQPASAAVVTVVSTSASDTTPTITVRGIVSGYETTETITLTGTSSASGSLLFSRIKGLSKSAVTVGSVAITSGATALATMAPKIKESRYKLVKFHYAPNAVLSISIPYIIKPLPLLDDNDYPIIDIADLLEIGAKADGWTYKRQFTKARALEGQFQAVLTEYIWEKENEPNQVTQFKPETFDRGDLY